MTSTTCAGPFFHARGAARIVGALLLAAVAVIGVPSANAAEGVVTAPSKYPVDKAVERLESAVKAKDFMVFAKVDHSAGAAKVGMVLRPTVLLIFGNPRGGTPLMSASQSAGLDLPLKMLVWEDAAGKVWLSYSDPAWIARRHSIDPDLAVVKGMTGGLAALAATAGQE